MGKPEQHDLPVPVPVVTTTTVVLHADEAPPDEEEPFDVDTKVEHRRAKTESGGDPVYVGDGARRDETSTG